MFNALSEALTDTLKTFVARLPSSTQHNLRQWHFQRQIRKGTFYSDEIELSRIDKLVRPASTVIDVGANVGHYTYRLSQVVGAAGYVVAVEPILETCAILAGNLSEARNVFILNVAASDSNRFSSMGMPKMDTGLSDFYQASLTTPGNHRVMCVSLDSLGLTNVSLIKIDAEGHEVEVLKGLEQVISRDRPSVIFETHESASVWLRGHGYELWGDARTPNTVALWPGSTAEESLGPTFKLLG